MDHADNGGTKDDGGTKLVGHVKWFDPTKGFGFIVAESGGPDILLHANVLRNFGQSSVAEGAIVQVAVQHTQRGIQAFEVLDIQPPPPDVATEGEDRVDPPFENVAHSGPLLPARVKWFDKAKGFGFANVFGRSEDVFVHIEVLRRSSLAELQPGEAVALRVAEGERGRLATQVATWEAGITDTGSAAPEQDVAPLQQAAQEPGSGPQENEAG